MSRKRVTSKEVLQYVYELVKPLARAANISDSGVSLFGLQDANTSGSSLIIRHTAGRSGEIQEGVVTVIIYTQPYTSVTSGQQMEDLRRTRDIERTAQDWVESLPTGEYLFWSDDTVQTDYDHEAGLYFTSIRLKYRHY